MHPFKKFLTFILLMAYQPKKRNSIVGTWKLITGTIVENGKTSITDYTQGQSFIKVINATHFTFMVHDLGKNSTRTFSAGGGRYEMKENEYTEHLEYCSDRNWEGHDFISQFKFWGTR